MLDAIIAHTESHADRFFGAQPARVVAHLLTMSRNKRYEAGRLLALIFADDAAAPSVVACFQRDARVEHRLAHEHRILEALAPSGLAPKSFGLERVGDRPVLFEEALPGPHAGGLLAHDAFVSPRDPEAVRERLADCFAAAGRYLERLQAQSVAEAPDCPHPALGSAARDYAVTFGLAGVEAALLTGLMDDYEDHLAEAGPVWLHGDLTLSNLAIAGDTVRAFDWEFGGKHLDRHRDAMHLAYYGFVSAYHMGLFQGQDFHRAFSDVFLDQRHWFGALLKLLAPDLAPARYRQALLACLVQDALLQSQVSLVFGTESRRFHRLLVGHVLGYELFREEMEAAREQVAALDARLTAESARRQALESRVPVLEGQVAALTAERDALAAERAQLDAQVRQLEGELGGLEARHVGLERHAQELATTLERINSRLVMRVYRRVRDGLAK